MNFPESSLENLVRLGYTEDEARFLCLAAIHSGYFSTRQFLQFTGSRSGEKSMAFSEKLHDKGHATARCFLRNGRVFHLFSRTVYRAIGRESLRHRRNHSLEYLRTRLVALDFVLAHLRYEYLETEADKLKYFCQQLDIPKELLPVKRYSGAIRGKATVRYFVDEFPMFLSPAFPSPPVVTFTFPDPGLGSLDSFTTHLHAYGRLFEALAEARLVYISPRSTQFESARKAFLAVTCGPPKRDPGEEILRYFRLRKLWDERKYSQIKDNEMAFLNESEKRYARHRCQERYPSWRDGTVSDDFMRSEIRDMAQQRKAIFQSELVDGQVALFEPTAKRKRTPSTVVEVKNSHPGTFGRSFRSVFAAGADKPMEK